MLNMQKPTPALLASIRTLLTKDVEDYSGAENPSYARSIPYADVPAAAAFGAVSCEEAESPVGWPVSILLTLRARSAGVKGFWMKDTPGINMSARINSPLYPVM